MPVRLQLFGTPQVDADAAVDHGAGTPLALPFERRHQVLVFLALKGGWVARADVAAMLWPDQPGKLASSNLRKALFRLQELPWGRCVESQGHAMRVVDATTDVAEFEAALREQRLAQALRLRRGELLAGFEDDASEAWTSWLGFERDRLRTAWRAAALSQLAAEGNAAEAVELSARLLEADPLDEAALQAHMHWLARSGQGTRARQAYAAFAQRLQQELGLAPDAALKSLHDALGAAATPVVQPPGLVPAPAEDHAFVGRSVELRHIASQLAQDGCRLLSLIGPGGVGKTRLARRALQDVAPAFADGVAFVALEGTASAGELGGRLARDLGQRLSGSAQPLEQVSAFLRERQMLLVLDNFEQLVPDAVPQLAALLQQCPGLKLLVTTRVRLALPAEWLLPVEGLPCPEQEDEDRLEAFDAARLFVNAARQVEPGLVPAAEAAAIVDICRQVGGLPLALELAAAWTRVLSCASIADELRQGVELLQAPDAAQAERHASIEMVFEQSWRLLTPLEREVLARLSVFRGGFTAEAARAVASASLPVLRALADKSLLRKEASRLFLHPLVQQLAGQRLQAQPDAHEAAESAHALHFHRLLAQQLAAIERADREALKQVDTEFDNLRAAWGWAVARRQFELLTRSAMALLQYCDHRGRLGEGLALLRAASEADPSRIEPLLWSAAAHCEYRLDRYPEAEASARRALAASRRLSRDRDARLQSFKVLGACCLRLGRHDEARQHYQQALEESPPGEYPRDAAALLDNLALVEKGVGRFDESLKMSMQSLVQHRQLGDAAGEALCLNNLGALQVDLGDHAAGIVNLKAALVLCERHGLVATKGLVLANLTELAVKEGDVEAAQRHGRQALEVAQAIGNRAIESWLRMLLVSTALQQGQREEARAQLRTALEMALAIGRPALQLAGLVAFAELLVHQGDADCAHAVLALAEAQPAINAHQRQDIRERRQRWGLPGDATVRLAAAATLAELVHRIAVESDVAHGPLMAWLRGVPQAAAQGG
jgi:predicted ATPase/DNA-binding SARP family transcriptional activator